MILSSPLDALPEVGNVTNRPLPPDSAAEVMPRRKVIAFRRRPRSCWKDRPCELSTCIDILTPLSNRSQMCLVFLHTLASVPSFS